MKIPGKGIMGLCGFISKLSAGQYEEFLVKRSFFIGLKTPTWRGY
jgi:hypothetical protein